MGWFKPEPVHARSGSAGVVVSLLRPPSARTMTLRLRLGREAMRATGWGADQRVELLFGDGPQAGAVMVRPSGDAAGPRLRSPHQRAANFLETTFGNLHHDPIAGVAGSEWTLPREVRKSADAEWRAEENALLVTLPTGWWQVAPPASVAGRREAAEADAEREARDRRLAAEDAAEVAPWAADAAAAPLRRGDDPGPPRSDPADPRVQDMALHLLSRGCSLPELQTRLRLDKAGFATLQALLRQRTLGKLARPRPGDPPRVAEEPVDVGREIARIRDRVVPNGGARS